MEQTEGKNMKHKNKFCNARSGCWPFPSVFPLQVIFLFADICNISTFEGDNMPIMYYVFPKAITQQHHQPITLVILLGYDDNSIIC